MKANPQMLNMFANRNKCFMCKRRFDKPFILPVEKIEPGVFKPNFNAEILFHVSNTHGIPYEILCNWIAGSIYGQELTEVGNRAFSVYGEQP